MKVSSGTRIVECAAFVADPPCAMTLARQGPDLIGFDPIDRRRNALRWPITRGTRETSGPGPQS